MFQSKKICMLCMLLILAVLTLTMEIEANQLKNKEERKQEKELPKLDGRMLGDKVSGNKLDSCPPMTRVLIKVFKNEKAFENNNPFDISVHRKYKELSNYRKILSTCYTKTYFTNSEKYYYTGEAIDRKTGKIVGIFVYITQKNVRPSVLFKKLSRKFGLKKRFGYNKRSDGPNGFVRHNGKYSIVGISKTYSVSSGEYNIALIWLWDKNKLPLAYEKDAKYRANIVKLANEKRKVEEERIKTEEEKKAEEKRKEERKAEEERIKAEEEKKTEEKRERQKAFASPNGRMLFRACITYAKKRGYIAVLRTEVAAMRKKRQRICKCFAGETARLAIDAAMPGIVELLENPSLITYSREFYIKRFVLFVFPSCAKKIMK